MLIAFQPVIGIERVRVRSKAYAMAIVSKKLGTDKIAYDVTSF
jgi:hypothetical protein